LPMKHTLGLDPSIRPLSLPETLSLELYNQHRYKGHFALNACDHCTSSTLIGGKGGAVQGHFTLSFEGPMEKSEYKMDVKSTWIPTWMMASNGTCFMITWTIFKNHLLEVCLTQNHETVALKKLTAVDLLYFIMYEDPA